VRGLQADAEVAGRFTAWHVEEPRPGVYAELPAGLSKPLVECCARRGLQRLYSHQAEAIEHALAGEDVLLATPTASGKTLAYTLPVLQSLLESRGSARALWMFPTKALSQDQSRSLNGWLEELGEDWHSFTYDGDTPPSVRRTLRDRGHVVLTNPWMLHQGILPNHGKWSQLFRDLRYIVIDEVHTLSGVFGSSVANVLRRAVRIARHYGSEPRFLLSSATVRDAAGHARSILGRDVIVVDRDGSPAAKRIFGVFDPPLLNPVAGLRANALEEVRRLAPRICGPGHQTIFFCNRRTAVEVLTRYLKESAPKLGLRASEIRGYRGGYLPLLRREIENGLKQATVKVVVSTNALELGIDIGRLDVACLVGYPGTQASFWQRAGRVGRSGRASLTLMIARSDPVDQYLAHHPEWLFGRARERLGLDPNNLVLLSEQIKCAAFELPFRGQAGPGGGCGHKSFSGFAAAPHAEDILDYLAEESELLLRRDEARGPSWYWIADAYPAQDVSLGGHEPDNVVVFDEDNHAIGEMDRAHSISEVHDGAIYQVEGVTYKIERFDYENRRAYAKKVDSDYFTEAETDTEVRVLRLEEKAGRDRAEGGTDWAVWRGEVHVTTLATLYKKIRFYTRENVGAEDIHLPPEELDTEAFVITVSEETAAELGLVAGDRAAAWRGVGRLLRRVAPLFLRCQPGDLGIACEIRSRHFEIPAIFLYDKVPGSVGLATVLFAERDGIVGAALEVLERCSCQLGCPACVGPLEEVGALGKETALGLLRHLEGGEPLGCMELEEGT
jgi:DEAD/DEAH box helicase domain-containing protein